MKYIALFLCLFLLSGCGSEAELSPTGASETLPAETTVAAAVPTEPLVRETEPIDPIDEMIYWMTIEERVGQLFLARCDKTAAQEHIAAYHLGGFVLFNADFEGETPDSMREKLAAYQAAGDIPLLIAVDEEGGTVTRVSSHKAFRDSIFPSPRTAYAQGGLAQTAAIEEEKCALLQSLGINVNLGPVCDIATERDAFMYQRSLGQDPALTAEFAANTVGIMNEYRIGSALKHFPGYGNNADTHVGIAIDSRGLSELEGRDLIPFAAGIEAGCGAVMVSHTIVEALDSELPASLSPAVHDYLRGEMGFAGVIVTDDLVMQAITDRYGAGEAAVMAVQAGNDLLCSTDYVTQYKAVLDAVAMGRIDIDTLNRAVRNVLEWKMELGLL